MTEIANSWNVSNRYLTGLGKVCYEADFGNQLRL